MVRPSPHDKEFDGDLNDLPLTQAQIISAAAGDLFPALASSLASCLIRSKTWQE